MEQKQKLSELTTEELVNMLVVRKFFQDYFQRGKDPAFWAKAVLEVEQELAKRRALT